MLNFLKDQRVIKVGLAVLGAVVGSVVTAIVTKVTKTEEPPLVERIVEGVIYPSKEE